MSDNTPRLHKLKAAGPCIVTIFGVTGDLTRRLLFPSLYHLARAGLLPRELAIVGFANDDFTEESLRERFRTGLAEAVGDSADPAVIDGLLSRLHYVKSDFKDTAGFERLRAVLDDVERQYQTGGNILFYLATAPEFFLEVPQHLHQAGLLREADGHWRRLVIEKPFGHDLDSARQLNRDLTAVAAESQIYRIDHYLGKETVQNILVFRFANGIFEPIWNRRYIDHVQITVAETLGVEARGRYYDHTGALRDMIPNHLIQPLAFIAMEPPNSFSASALHNEQVKMLEAVSPLKTDDCQTRLVTGQYGAGTEGDKAVPAYRQESFVAPDSKTETYVALKLEVDNWRWAGVPFYLRTGKRLAARTTTVTIQFKDAPLSLFRNASAALPEPNRLVINVQPAERIDVEFAAKVPGPEVTTASVAMRFSYGDYFGQKPETGYETLLYDVMIGDSTLFKRGDTIELGWAIVTPVLDSWKQPGACELYSYAAGSQGPDAATEMMRRDGREWRRLT